MHVSKLTALLVNQLKSSNLLKCEVKAAGRSASLLFSTRRSNMGGATSSFMSRSPMNTPEGQFVQDTLDNHDAVIFSKTTCSYCDMAKNVLNDVGVKYKVVELNQRDDGGKIQNVLGHLTGAHTVPRVFVNQKCIGGGSDVKALHQKGQLLEMLRNVPHQGDDI